MGLGDGGERATVCPRVVLTLLWGGRGGGRESGCGAGGWEEHNICGDSMSVQGKI
jgi:hypothetical protein